MRAPIANYSIIDTSMDNFMRPTGFFCRQDAEDVFKDLCFQALMQRQIRTITFFEGQKVQKQFSFFIRTVE
jgi:hypothetical protein